MPSEEPITDQQRDAESLIMLGMFFAVLGGLVIIGTFWALSRWHAAVVNFIAGLVLAVIGALFLWSGFRMKRRRSEKQAPPGS